MFEKDQTERLSKIKAPASERWGDLRDRFLTALAIMLIAGLCIYNGGLLWAGFVALGGFFLIIEWIRLIRYKSNFQFYVWLGLGLFYIGINVFFLIYMRDRPKGASTLYSIILGVVATDVGAYFAGRFIGGKKIAPAISPSKTWAGLFGGAFLSAFAFVFVFSWIQVNSDFVGTLDWVKKSNAFELNLWAVAIGVFLAMVAQCGDFFESWMKRNAGVKDSGSILPGHGGIFDRVDGLLAVTLVAGSSELFTNLVG